MPHRIGENTIAGAAVAATSVASGTATLFDVLEHGVGLAASIVGLVLASLLIWKTIVSIQTKRLELKILEDEERRKEARRKK